MKTYDYINRVVLTLPLSVYEGTWITLSPLVAMHHHDLACAKEFFLNYYVPQHIIVLTLLFRSGSLKAMNMCIILQTIIFISPQRISLLIHMLILTPLL